MNLDLQTLGLFFLAGFGGWYWWRSLETKEHATRAARACGARFPLSTR